MLGSTVASAQQAVDTKIEIARLNNIGVAFMNQQLPQRALQRFEGAQKLDARAAVPLLNQGIALFYMQKLPEAERALRAAAEADSSSPRPWYCLGILHLSAGDPSAAQADLKQAVALDPKDADAHYFLGTADLKLQAYAAATVEFTETLHLNPLHASAEFGLARALQHSGSADGARTHLARFQELTDQKNGTTVSAQYSEQGRYAMAEEMPLPLPVVGPMIPVRFLPRELEGRSTGTQVAKGEAASGGFCLIDLDGSGQETILTVGDGDQALRAFRFKAQALTELDLKGSGLALSGHGVSCAVGDWDNDGLPDLAVALTDRMVLYRNLGHGRFVDVTEKVGLKALNRPAGLTFVDFDHDGDLDLFITGAPSRNGGTANVLWRNNGNQTFTEWTSAPALAGVSETSAAAVSDLNNDRAIDFVVAGKSASPTVYLNRREGPFQRTEVFGGVSLPATRGVAVADFDKDGWMDVALTHSGAPGVSLWHNVDGHGFRRIALPLTGVTGAWGVTALDLDNDGWIDLAMLVETSSGTQIRVLRNCGPQGFQDVTQVLGLDKVVLTGARSLAAADLTRRGAVDLVVGRGSGTPLVLENVGGDRNRSLRIKLTGLADNKSAIGTKVEVFADGLWQKFELAGSSGYASQGSLEIVAGLGTHERVDIVRLLWPTGVPQDELDVSAGEILSSKESDRRKLLSCSVCLERRGV